MTRNRKVFAYIIKKAQTQLDVEAIFLFGSRARNDARKSSDFDFAFVFDPRVHQKDWARFCLDVKEEAPTLLPLDLINMNEIDSEFKQKIMLEGQKIYTKEIQSCKR